jgi:cyclic pyranopterin phosphate synthase
VIISEWVDKYNSFNSYKGLMYKQWYDAILEGRLLPPVECSVDPVNDCNLDCIWCNGRDVKDRKVYMDGKHLVDLVQFFVKCGAKAVCFAGGGEPTMHENLDQAFIMCKKLSFPCAIITNGLFKENQFEPIADAARWVGVSVDAATKETYKELKKVDAFNKVISNISKLVNLGCREVTYKFLLHTKNQHEVFRACEIARTIGAHRVHIRPISYKNFQETEEDYDIQSIVEQVDNARRLFECDKFQIYFIQHKFDENLHRKFGFSKCRATPIMPIFHANGDISACIDRKADKSLVFGKHNPIEEILACWGNQKHKEVINQININQCPKCTINYANEQIEQCVIKNKCDWEFV